MGDGIFGISISGMRAAQIGLATTGHNITNVSTPGFHRQELIQSANTPLRTGSGYIGQGVNVDTVRRAYSAYLDNQVNAAQTGSSYLDTYYAEISQINNMLADPLAGLSPALQGFFAGVNEVAAHPESIPARQSMLSSSEALVSRFHALNQRFEEIRDGVNSQVSSTVSVINSYARNIADLNHQIVLADAGGNGQPANDLLDQRDQLIADLNKEINVTVVRQDDGAYNIFIGRGQALVVGQQALELVAVPDPANPENTAVAYKGLGGATTYVPDTVLDGGNLGGLLAFRRESLDPSQNQLGLVAVGLAQTFNAQHLLGDDLNGDPGDEYFNVRGVTGASGPYPIPYANVIPNGQNTGAGSPDVTLTDVTQVTASDYRLDQTATGFTLTRLSDNVAQSFAALPQTVDGLTIAAFAGGATGDSWIIQPTRLAAQDIGVAITDTRKIAAAATGGGAYDNTNALLLADLQTQPLLQGGTATYQNVYSQLVSDVGTKTRDVYVTGQAQATLLSQSQSAQQSLSGVNLDEEAANLMRYQMAYQASGKMMQTAMTVFNTLLELGN